MKQLEHFFLLIDQCLNDTEFIRRHILLLIDRGMSMEIIQNVLCLIAMVIK